MKKKSSQLVTETRVNLFSSSYLLPPRAPCSGCFPVGTGLHRLKRCRLEASTLKTSPAIQLKPEWTSHQWTASRLRKEHVIPPVPHNFMFLRGSEWHSGLELLFLRAVSFLLRKLVRHPVLPTCTCRSSAVWCHWMHALHHFFFLTFCVSLLHPFCPCRQMFSLSSCSGHLPQPSMRRAKLLRRLRSRFVRGWGVIFICQTFIPARDALLPSVMHSFPINKKLTLTCTNVTEKKRSLSVLCSVLQNSVTHTADMNLDICRLSTQVTCVICSCSQTSVTSALKNWPRTKKSNMFDIWSHFLVFVFDLQSSSRLIVYCWKLKTAHLAFCLEPPGKKPKTINVSDILADN